jgi:hypothetical protein
MMRSAFGLLTVTSCAMVVLGCVAGAQATTYNVATASALHNALVGARWGDEIVVAAGTYTFSNDQGMSYPGVTLRGATGNRDDVVLKGGGFNSTSYARIVLHCYAADCVVKDLTIGDCYWHAIQVHNGADRLIIRNVRCYNAGEQVIKGVQYSHDGLMENCLLEYTAVRINDGVDRPDDYVGGIDLHGAIGWTIRDNVIRNIIGQNGEGDAGVFLWNVSSNCTAERNVIYGCNKGIAYGNPSNGSGTWAMNGGIVRNNFVYARTAAPADPVNEPWGGNADLGMEMCYTKDVKVYNNTIWTDSGSFFRAFQVYASAAIQTTNLQLKYNIIRGSILSTYANGTWTSTGDIIGNAAQASWFFDAANANLHLTKLATAAIDHAVLLADVPTDFDQQARPIGSAPDVGADEYVAADLTGDGHVDVADLLILVNSWGKLLGQPGYNAAADLNGSNGVDVSDLLILAGSWGL